MWKSAAEAGGGMIETLTEALEPFAKYGNYIERIGGAWGHDETCFVLPELGDERELPTSADFKRARAVLTPGG